MATIEERKGKDGNTTYRARVRLKGYPAQSATFERKTDARRWIASTEAAIREGRHFKTSESKKRTLSEALDRYMKEILPRKPKSLPHQTRQLKWWIREIGEYSLADVTTALISDARSKLLNENISAEKESGKTKTRSSATANRYIAALSHALNIAYKEWGWINDNPCSRLSKLPEPRGRRRFLSEDERSRLLQVCKNSNSKHLYPIVVLAISTGMRKEEILSLEWSQVDFHRRVITLYETKNNETRVVPLVSHALGVLKDWQEVHGSEGLLFPNTRDKTKPIDIRSPWYTVLKRADIENFRFHDLRHSAASYLAMNGASLAEIAEVLGHKTLQMVKRYAHLSEAHTSAVVERMNEGIFEDGKVT